MDPLSYDTRESGNRWIAYFDRLGFKAYCRTHDLVDVFCESCAWLTIAEQACEGLSDVNLVWFSDTLLFYSTDDSRRSFQAIDGAATSFFDELIDSQIPVRGALAFGEFYVDKARNLFLGKALIDACEYGENFNWLGYTFHPSALKRMDEVGQPVSDLVFQRRKAEFKNTATGAMEMEEVVAYVVGPGSIMPLTGGQSYQRALREMASATTSSSNKRKYLQTIDWITGFSFPPPSPPRQSPPTRARARPTPRLNQLAISSSRCRSSSSSKIAPPPVAPIHDMIHRPRMWDAQLPSHAPRFIQRLTCGPGK